MCELPKTFIAPSFPKGRSWRARARPIRGCGRVTTIEIVKDLLLIFLGPAGIWFGWALQRTDKKAERAYLRQQLLRTKAEEIYFECDALIGKHTEEVLKNQENVRNATNEYIGITNASKLKMLIRMYFPDAEHLAAEYEGNIRELTNRMRQRAKEASNLTAEQSLKRYREDGSISARERFDIGLDFAMKLRNFMDVAAKELV